MRSDVIEFEFEADGESRWAGMLDCVLVSPDRRHRVALRYLGEPPQGDSYHEAEIDGTKLPGLFWGGRFAFTPDSRYLAGSWMSRLFERRTIVVDLPGRRCFVLPCYVVDFSFHWPLLRGKGTADTVCYRFEGGERWAPF